MDLKNIFIQQIVKRYSENHDSKISKFMENKYQNIEHKKYYIVSHQDFRCKDNIQVFSKERKKEFEDWLKENFKNSEDNIRKIFNDFINNNY